jgi:CheY-like chemotaxis protein
LDPETHRNATDADTIRLLFSVQDTGMGIPADRIQELFKPFTQADGSIDRMHEGTGLGLSICQRLVETMGGKIWLGSTIGKGTTFFFTIELKRMTDQEEARLLPPENLKDQNVLIMDANDTSCRHLHEILSRCDCTVASANTVRQGVDLLEQGLDNQPYELVLMERTMPEMNGFIAARSIKNNPEIRKLGSLPKIILMSMHELEAPSLSHNGSLGEIDGYLLKPINTGDLIKTIAAAYDQSKDVAACQTEDVCGEDLQGLKDLAGSRILLVEDNETNQKFSVALLSMMGLRVDVSANGRKAFAQLKQNQQADRPGYDAVLMDIEMPVMDGYTATRIIRSDPVFEELPIIAMTAHALKGTKSKCLDAGMNDYISKPVDEKKLCNVLVKHIQPSPQSRPRQPEVEQAIGQENWYEMPDHIPGINLQRTLYRIGGNAGLLKRILDSFLEQFSDADRQIRQLLTQDHKDRAKKLIHTIKGTSGNIGAEALHVAARELERQILSGSASASTPAMNTFIEKHRQVIDSLASLDLNHDDDADPHAESGGPMDVDAITELLLEIENLLKKSDSRVRHMLPKLRGLIQNQELKAVFNRLDRAVYRLDSDHALKCVSEMNAIIQAPPHQAEESPHVDER